MDKINTTEEPEPQTEASPAHHYAFDAKAEVQKKLESLEQEFDRIAEQISSLQQRQVEIRNTILYHRGQEKQLDNLINYLNEKGDE